MIVSNGIENHFKISNNIRVTKMPPCDLLAITAWEQRYSTQLPEVR